MKPWEMGALIDTMELWKFGKWDKSGNGMNRLDHLAFIHNIVSPKGDLDGSKVHAAFWNGEHDRIKAYCEEDIRVPYELLLTWKTSL